jgi:hypothetical protein
MHAYDCVAAWKLHLIKSANMNRERMQAGEWEWERGWADAGVERRGQRQGEGNKGSEKKCTKLIEKPIEKPAEKPGGKKWGDGRESRGRLMRFFSGRNK